jgi:hypothetical protein
VNSGTASHVAIYSANGTAVSGDSALTDDGTTMSYAGTGGISAATASFSGNVTVNGELQVAGPWLVSSVPPSSGMGAAASGDSAIGIKWWELLYFGKRRSTEPDCYGDNTHTFVGDVYGNDDNDWSA